MHCASSAIHIEMLKWCLSPCSSRTRYIRHDILSANNLTVKLNECFKHDKFRNVRKLGSTTAIEIGNKNYGMETYCSNTITFILVLSSVILTIKN